MFQDPFSTEPSFMPLEQSESFVSAESASQQSSFVEKSDLGLSYTLSGINTTHLSDLEALTLATQLNLKYQMGKLDLKGKLYAGIAPTRFNLNKHTFGKYVARIVFQHKWKSQRARLYWHKVRMHVLKREGFNFMELEDEDEDDQDRTMVQGFKCHQHLRRPYEIISTCYHLHVPAHYQDGSLGLDGEMNEYTKDRLELEEDENFFDKKVDVKKSKSYSLVSIDTKHHLTIWDIHDSEPRVQVKMEYNFKLIAFISRHFMYAGLLDQRTIKFFTPKLLITSGVVCKHEVQNLTYFAPRNELIAAGTKEISIWTLDAIIKGDLCIVPTLRLHIIPKLQEDEWLDMVYVLMERKQIWVIANVNILVYNYQTGEYLHAIRHVTSRRISCIAHHPEYQYILVGCVDGTIKVINIVNATVHEFVSHSKSVVAISVFPSGPLVVSCSADQTLRLYNLKYFKEICSVNIKERPIGMDLMDDVYLYIQTRSTIQIWATNQFNINFTTMSSSVTKLLYISDKKKPARVIARTADGMNRLLSPVSGRAITSNLPLLEVDTVTDIAYSLALDRLFVLLDSGEIWVFRTDQNPCTIVDLWKSEEASTSN
jgi:WD40 repeat protein